MKKTILIFTMLTMAAANGWSQNDEIIYHDNITPNEMHADEPWPGSHRMFDFDDDSTQDFFIAWSAYREWHIIAYTYGNWWYERQALEFGDTISTVSNWFPEPENVDHDLLFELASGYSSDSIIVGFKNQVSDNKFCYGWIRFSLDAGPEINYNWPNGVCTFIDYAYCTIPDYPLRAGQTSLNWDMDETEAMSFATLHPNPTTGFINVIGKDLKAVEILNTLGQRVATAKGEDERLIVDISSLPTGIYFVTITDEEGRKYVKKVVKE